MEKRFRNKIIIIIIIINGRYAMQCFTVTGSFLITIHLFGSSNFPG